MKWWLDLVSKFNRKAKNLAIRLVKWTGKSKEYIHPKHLIADDTHHWFEAFLKPADVVLDLGCGSGAHSLVAAKVAKFVKGIDYSDRNLEIAKKLACDKNIQNVAFENTSLEGLLRELDGSYSGILALDILEHLVDRDQFLREARRILADQGKLFLSVPNVETNWKQLLKKHNLFYYSDLDHKHEYTKREIEEILKDHGFRILHWDATVYDTPWVGLIDVVGGISLSIYKRLSEWKRKKGIQMPKEATGFRIVAEKV